MNLIEVITQEMANDEELTGRQSWNIRRAYVEANEDGKQAINSVLIALCGWSMETLLTKVEPDEEDERTDDDAPCVHPTYYTVNAATGQHRCTHIDCGYQFTDPTRPTRRWKGGRR